MCKQVLVLWQVRQQQRVLAEWSDRLAGPLTGPEKNHDRILAELSTVVSFGGAGLVTPVDGVEQVLDRMEAEETDRVATGMRDLDDLLGGGLEATGLYVVGARPAMGKTAFGLCVALNAAALGVPVLFKSMEMSARQLWDRALANIESVQMDRITDRNVPSERLTSLAIKARDGEVPLYVDDEGTSTMAALRTGVRRMPTKPGLVVVDYLQLMVGEGRHSDSNRVNEVSEISRQLKQLAMELEIPVLALSQLNRNVESRVDKRPMLADIRESGSIEQDSNVVVFLYRDEVYNPESVDRGLAELIVAKNRSGPTGTRQVAWLPHFQRFANLARV